MKRQFNLNVFGEDQSLDLSLNKLIGTTAPHTPAPSNFPKLQSEAALSLGELSTALDSLCEELLHTDEDILLASSTEDFIGKYAATKALGSIDELLALYSNTSIEAPKPSSKIDFKDLLEGF
ncbi:MAG: hypothetical protein ACRCW2_02685 [Cellulosilyticaceae bacterium]